MKVFVSPVPVVGGTVSPVVLDPGRGLYFAKDVSSLPRLVRTAIRAHPWSLQDGLFAFGAARLVVSPVAEKDLRGARVIVAAEVDDAGTRQALARFSEEGGKVVRAGVEMAEGPRVLPDDLVRMIPARPFSPALPDLLEGLPVGFGKWLNAIYVLPSSKPESPTGYGLLVGGGAASVVAANILRYRAPEPNAFAQPLVVARALRVLLHLLDDMLIWPDPIASSAAVVLSRLEAEALFRTTPSPTQVVREVADACGIPPNLASQAYEAAVAVAAAGVEMDEKEKTRWGMSAKDLFALIRAPGDRPVLQDGVVLIINLRKRIALAETVYVRASPMSLVFVRASRIPSVAAFPAVLPDPEQSGGDLPAVLLVPAEPDFAQVLQTLQRHFGGVVRLTYRALESRVEIIGSEPISAHALDPLLDAAASHIRRIAGGGWSERADGVGLRIQAVLSGEEEKAEKRRRKKNAGGRG